MDDWPEELLAGVDRPRPLDPAARARLEEQILAASEPTRPIDEDLAARLQGALGADDEDDDVVHALAGVDAARPLDPAVREKLARSLSRRRPRWVPVGASAAAAAAVIVALAASGTLSGTRAPGGVSALHRADRGSPTTALGAGGAGPSGAAGSASGIAGTAGGGATLQAPSAAAPLRPTELAQRVPVVGALRPGSGPAAGGTWVTVEGSGLGSITSVFFGTVRAPRFSAVGDTELRVLSPAHDAGTVDVTVAGPGGTSARGPSDRYTYLSH